MSRIVMYFLRAEYFLFCFKGHFHIKNRMPNLIEKQLLCKFNRNLFRMYHVPGTILNTKKIVISEICFSVLCESLNGMEILSQAKNEK